jgi:uncharacterized phage protein gp47/JayE
MSLYSDRTFENLQSEMLNDTSTDVDQQEGSLVATSIAKQALRLEEAYGALDYVNDNMLVDTQDRDHLIATGEECGLPIKEGTKAVLLAVINCEVEVGTEFTAMDTEYNYEIEEYIGRKDVEVTDDDGNVTTESWYEYHIEADEEGVEPGTYTGQIEPIEYVEGFDEGRIESLVTAGTDEEDTEEYRLRRLAWFDTKPCAGNRAYYKNTIKALGTVGGLKIERRKAGETSVPIYIQDASYGVPTTDLCNQIKASVDPKEYEGEGYGLAPIGHVVTINPVTAVTVNVSFTMTLKTGITYTDIKTQVEDACKSYITTLCKDWENQDYLIVRLSGFETALLKLDNVVDVENVKINDTASNLTLTTYQIPTLGTVTEA